MGGGGGGGGGGGRGDSGTKSGMAFSPGSSLLSSLLSVCCNSFTKKKENREWEITKADMDELIKSLFNAPVLKLMRHRGTLEANHWLHIRLKVMTSNHCFKRT